MARPWATLSCAIAVTAGSQAWALSIGEPQTLSYLSEPLQVHLPVSDWAGAPAPENYRLRLLPDQAYAAHGLSAPNNRPADLSVQWRRDGQSEPYVVIRTQRPITEPILTLLLEMRSGKQVAVRQIDLLLDLPAGAQSRKAGSALPMRAPRRVVTRPSARIQTRSYGPVRPGESLSRIAQKVRPDPSISLARMAGALMQANPDAFPGGADSLRMNVTLRIPSLDEIRSARPLDNLYTARARRTVGDKTDVAAKSRPQAFLPRAVYTRGRLWALTMEFPSYEAIRPVDLTPKLKALEAKEPILFKADWTLGSTGAAQKARVPQASVPTPPEPTITATVETPVATTTEQSQEERTEPAAPPSEHATASGMDLAQTTESTPEAAPQSAQPADSQTESDAAPPPDADADADATSESTTLWPWLLAGLGVIGAILWWRRGIFTIAVPVRDDEQDAPLHDAAAGLPEDQPSLKEQRAIARLRKRLAPWLQMNDGELQRQAHVALALLERDRLDQAQRLIDELEQNPAPEPQQKPEAAPQTDSPPDNKKPYNPAAEQADSQPTELEQRRIRERLKALRRKPLPEASQRQLKVAEAFYDRGNLAQAHSILSGLNTSSDD